MLKKLRIMKEIYKNYPKLQHLLAIKKMQTRGGNKFSTASRKIIWKRSKGMCQHPNCHATTQLTYDHIIPKALGGANSVENGQILCLNHNRKKANKIQ